jgi:endonuclease G
MRGAESEGSAPGGAYAQLKFGAPADDLPVVHHENFSAAVDARMRVPRWVVEYMSESTTAYPPAIPRAGVPFRADPTVSEHARAELSAYERSGYDRGHMACVANHRRSAEATVSSFLLSNIAPQVHAGFNAGYWARMERMGRRLTERYEDVFVLSGPLFLPTRTADGRWESSHEWIGAPPKLVAVPTHYFKVFLCVGRRHRVGAAAPAGEEDDEDSDGQGVDAKVAELVRRGDAAVAGFVVPNRSMEDNVPLETFLVPLRDLEMVGGFRVFPQAPATLYDLDERSQSLRESSAAWWRQPVDRTRQSNSSRFRVTAAPGSETISAVLRSAARENRVVFSEPFSVPFQDESRLWHLCDVDTCKLPPPYEAPSSSSSSSSSSSD